MVFINSHIQSKGIEHIPVQGFQKVNIRLLTHNGSSNGVNEISRVSNKQMGQVKVFVLTYSPIDVPLYSGDNIINVLQTAFAASKLTFMLEYDGTQPHPELALKALDGIIAHTGRPGWVTSVGTQEHMNRNVSLTFPPLPGDVISFGNKDAPSCLLPPKNK